MTYPVSNVDVPDAYTRGKVEMFAKLVEIQNEHPTWVDDAVIDELYKEVDDACSLSEKRYVFTRPSGDIITE